MTVKSGVNSVFIFGGVTYNEDARRSGSTPNQTRIRAERHGPGSRRGQGE